MFQLAEISPHVVACTEPECGGNVGGIAFNSFCIAIDSTHNLWKGREFRRQLEGYFGLPVKYLFLTHHHSDHAKGLDAFSNIEIISSIKTAAKVKSLTSIQTFPTILFQREYVIEEDDSSVRIVKAGGHTSDSSYLYYRNEDVIFAGDLVFENYLFFAGYQSDPTKWLNALKEFKELKPRIIVPGHGPPLTSIKDLDKHILLLQSFIEVIHKAREKGIPAKEMEIPNFVYQQSTRIPKIELEKWFKRTAISWYKRV